MVFFCSNGEGARLRRGVGERKGKELPPLATVDSVDYETNANVTTREDRVRVMRHVSSGTLKMKTLRTGMYGMVFLPQNPSAGNGRILGCDGGGPMQWQWTDAMD